MADVEILDVNGNALHVGDVVELVRCDQWRQHEGKRGVIDHHSGNADDPTITVLFDDPDFPGYITASYNFRRID